MWMDYGWRIVRILIILVISRIVIIAVNKAIIIAMDNRESKRLNIQARRMLTVGKLLRNVATYVIHFVSVLLILSEFNIELGPLLAGAGVVGLAIGFGAQSLVKDIITGFFIIVEDQFAVGDVIETGSFKGTVEVIGLRTTRLKSWTGEVRIIPNGAINEVTNFSFNNSVAVIDLSIPYTADINLATEIIKQTTAAIEDENLAKEPVVLGVQTIAAAKVTLRIIAECKPNTQEAVVMRLNAEIKKALDAHQIALQ
ncbi:mechanosensitive ion channel family protein [Paenibacillaceae bacterium]|nr:mechanosensitive ion channel family protein [Paenibacillaceae bacterium]